MAPFTIETVTIVVIVIISIIFAVYLLILKKMGWLARSDTAKSDTIYRCPNNECRKTFQKPVYVKDLSAPSRVYPTCPECGFNLAPILGARVPATSSTLQQNKENIKIGGESSKIEAKRVIPVEPPNRKPMLNENEKTKTKFENRKDSGNTSISAKQPVEPKTKPETFRNLQESNSARKALEEEKAKPKTENPTLVTGQCSYYFGYLRTLPKGTEVPQHCYFCSKMIDCYKI